MDLPTLFRYRVSASKSHQEFQIKNMYLVLLKKNSPLDDQSSVFTNCYNKTNKTTQKHSMNIDNTWPYCTSRPDYLTVKTFYCPWQSSQMTFHYVIISSSSTFERYNNAMELKARNVAFWKRQIKPKKSKLIFLNCEK